MTGEVSVHPQGLCESDQVGPGTRVWAFAHVMPGAVVGRDCNIGESSYVEGGAVLGDGVTVKNGVQVWDAVTVGDGVFLGPNATLTNDLRPRAFMKKGAGAFVPTSIGRGATIGANATVVCGNDVGAFAFVAAGTVVHRPVPAHALVAGNPSRQVGWVCRCAERLGDDLTCPVCGRHHEPDGDGLREVDPRPGSWP